jgi:hypothetical protein
VAPAPNSSLKGPDFTKPFIIIVRVYLPQDLIHPNYSALMMITLADYSLDSMDLGFQKLMD